MHCHRPRVKCGKEVHVVTALWARVGSPYTLLFEICAMLLVKSMPVNHARKLLEISHTAMTHTLRYWVKKAVAKNDLSNVRAICVNETSFINGQSYVAVISDLKIRRVIDVEKKR